MKDNEARTIFRVDAIRRYARGKDDIVLARFASPRITRFLWVLSGLLLAGGFLLWLMRVPVYVSCVAVPISTEHAVHTAVSNAQQPLVALFLPSRTASRLRLGQKVFWSFSKTGPRVSRSVLEVRLEPTSPDAAQREFGLQGQASLAIKEPVQIGFVSLLPIPDDVPAAAHVGTVFHAEIEIGSRRVISLVPFVGRFFRD